MTKTNSFCKKASIFCYSHFKGSFTHHVTYFFVLLDPHPLIISSHKLVTVKTRNFHFDGFTWLLTLSVNRLPRGIK